MLQKLFLSFLLFVSCFFLTKCEAQWLADARLTNAAGNSFTGFDRSLSAAGNILHVAWSDYRDGNSEIYYKASGDGGVTWSPDARMTNNSSISEYPSIWVSGPDVHIVWSDQRNGNTEIYYKRSVNGGFSWSGDIRLTNNSSGSGEPSITAAGQIVHLAWVDWRDGNNEIYYKASADGGLSWSPDARLTNNSANSQQPSIWVSGPDVHLVWHDTRNGNYAIFYKRSTNGGFSWGSDVLLNSGTSSAQYPSITATGDIVHLVWEDYRNGSNSEIYYKTSGNRGVNWSPDARLTNDGSFSAYPCIYVSGPYVHVTWNDNRSGNYEIYHKMSFNGGFTWGSDLRLTINSAASSFSSIAVQDSKVHVVWQDNRDGNWEIYYKRNPIGNPVGIEPISSEIPGEFSLEQNYPNPFNPVTTIKFSIPQASFVKLLIYDITGREAAELINQQMSAGVYSVDFNASELSSGVYLYKLETAGFVDVKKMLLVK
jgi:hypothetical protein